MNKQGKSEARNHHFVPQGYLKGFTKNGSKNSKLVVFDLATKGSFETIPRNVGAKRDFNRIDVPGLDPNFVESGMSDFEGKAARALERVSETRIFTGENRDYILNLIALLSIRHPSKRENWRGVQSRIVEMFMDVTLSSKERWETSLKQSGMESTVTYEQALDFHREKRYRVEVPTDKHLELEAHGIDAILPLLHQRKWTLLHTGDSKASFITTDHPVILSFMQPEAMPERIRYSPGFGLKGTTVQFPISKTSILLGEFEGKESSVPINRKAPAILNSKAACYAYRQVYAPSREFELVGPEGALVKGYNLFSLFREV
jgi:hypothetical protein